MMSLLAQATSPKELGGPIRGAGTVGELVVASADSPEGLTALFEDQLSNVIALITVVGGLFFLIYFLIAGFEWLRSGGDKGKTDSARTRMTNGAIGLLIMIIAMGIVGIVGGVFGLDILNPGELFLQLAPGGATP